MNFLPIIIQLLEVVRVMVRSNEPASVVLKVLDVVVAGARESESLLNDLEEVRNAVAVYAETKTDPGEVDFDVVHRRVDQATDRIVAAYEARKATK